MKLLLPVAVCDQYHAYVVASRADISKARWDPEDGVPGRSIEAIKGRRRNQEYKSLVAALLSDTKPQQDT